MNTSHIVGCPGLRGGTCEGQCEPNQPSPLSTKMKDAMAFRALPYLWQVSLTEAFVTGWEDGYRAGVTAAKQLVVNARLRQAEKEVYL